MTHTRKKILFVLYVLLTGIILLYFLFPANAVKDHLVNRIREQAQDVTVSINSLRLVFPPALLLTEVTVSRNKIILFSVDRLKLFPKWRSMFTSNKVILFRGQAYQGNISGSFSPSQTVGTGYGSVSGSFTGIVLEQIPALSEQMDIGLSGSLSGEFHADAVSSRAATGSGNVLITDVTVAPTVAFLGMDQLTFQRVDADFDFEGNLLKLQSCDFQGPDLDATVSGAVFFESPIDQSELDLDIAAAPRREGQLFSSLSDSSILNLRATGSFGNPKLAFGMAR